MKACTCKGLTSYLFKQTELCESCVKKKEKIDNNPHPFLEDYKILTYNEKVETFISDLDDSEMLLQRGGK